MKIDLPNGFVLSKEPDRLVITKGRFLRFKELILSLGISLLAYFLCTYHGISSTFSLVIAGGILIICTFPKIRASLY